MYIILFIKNFKRFLKLKNNIKINPLVISFKINWNPYLLGHNKKKRIQLNKKIRIIIRILKNICMRKFFPIEIKANSDYSSLVNKKLEVFKKYFVPFFIFKFTLNALN